MNILSRVQVVSCNYEIFTEKVGMMSTGKSLARAIVMSSSVDYSLAIIIILFVLESN